MAYYNQKKVMGLVRTVPLATSAQEIPYDNTTSGLDATNVQTAIDETLSISNKLAEEQTFTTNSIIEAQNHGVEILVVETFKDVNNIDQTLLDGATVVANYWQENKHAIIKTSDDVLQIESTLFTLDNAPYKAWCNLDYNGVGDITIYLSKNNGVDWQQLNPGVITDLNYLVQKQIRIKLVLDGTVTLKNLAWGVM